MSVEPQKKQQKMDGMAKNGTVDSVTVQELNDAANRMRVLAIEMTSAAKSGHPTSACSAAEVVAVLFYHTMRHDPKNPRDPNSDRFVLSKGHACPILYAAQNEMGHLSTEDVMKLRKIDTDIEGHPTPRLDFIDVATGSLGQGLGFAAGMAYVGKNIDKASYRVFCVLGDGEAAEGSVWEAAGFASHYNLNNLIAIVDVNRLGQSQATSLGHDFEAYRQRFEAFGFDSHIVDGHDVEALMNVFAKAGTTDKPLAVIAKTFKGKGIEHIEDLDNWHGKPVPIEKIKVIQARIVNKGKCTLTPPAPIKDASAVKLNIGKIKMEAPAYTIGQEVATRAAYGTALSKMGKASPYVIALDGDVKNSTFSEKFLKIFPERFVECYIAEQNLISVAIGAQTRGRTIPFCSTFGAFFTRSMDHLRMGAISFANIKCVGSHVGVSIGEDGPSQMALEDLSCFAALAGSTVFYPSDAVSCERAVELAANIQGIVYIRTSRPATAVIYGNDEKFGAGIAKVVRQSAKDEILLIGAGVTLYECISAADQLAKEGITAAVIDLFSFKPVDEKTIQSHAKRIGKVITVEDHYYHGGIGSVIAMALADCTSVRQRCMAVEGVPRSGPPKALMEMFGISAGAIVAKAKEFLQDK